MELREYQQQAMQTCTPSSNNLAYMLLNLQGEVGEFSGKIAKAIRKDEVRFIDNDIIPNMHTSREKANTFYDELRKEGGDILWQLFGVFSALGWDAEVVAAQNLAKLRSRQERGVIVGDGDNR